MQDDRSAGGGGVNQSCSVSARRTLSSACSDSGLSSLLSAHLDLDNSDNDSILDDHLARVWHSSDAPWYSETAASAGCQSVTHCGRGRELIAADQDAATALCDAVRRLEHSTDSHWTNTGPTSCSRHLEHSTDNQWTNSRPTSCFRRQGDLSSVNNHRNNDDDDEDDDDDDDACISCCCCSCSHQRCRHPLSSELHHTG